MYSVLLWFYKRLRHRVQWQDVSLRDMMPPSQAGMRHGAYLFWQMCRKFCQSTVPRSTPESHRIIHLMIMHLFSRDLLGVDAPCK